MRNSEFTRGANNNASGVALLLALADRLRDRPLRSTEVWLVATGSKEMWLSGMRHFFRGLRVDKKSTYFVNVSGVGAGTLRYVTGEGMLHVFPSSRKLVALAGEAGTAYGARPLVYRGPATDALVPMARGYATLGVMATESGEVPAQWGQRSDRVSRVDLDALENAVDYVDAIARRLDATVTNGDQRRSE